MDQSIQNKEFIFLTKGLRAIFTFIMVVAIFGVVIMGCVLAGAMIVPEQTVNSIIDKGTISAAVNFNGMEIVLADQEANNIRYVKQDVVKLIAVATIYMGILLFIVVQVRRLLGSLSGGDIFTKANSKKIEWIAYSILLLSLTVGVFHTYISYTIGHLVHLDTLLLSTDWVAGVNYQFSGINWTLLFTGLIIWTIARIFRYGAFLQDEYDATV
ncbi:DUF2975 domain-containing protein [Lysinibacillus sp. NPDC096418]|uniref:DUF2975 domain-containing protein n=1 Tax=Lysinibacillus sp. NPDC096418 TaxID=3364138 RepID=UPI0038088305